MCRLHDTLVAEQDYGEDVMARFRAATRMARNERPPARVNTHLE
jgi:hypothetical protein